MQHKALGMLCSSATFPGLHVVTRWEQYLASLFWLCCFLISKSLFLCCCPGSVGFSFLLLFLARGHDWLSSQISSKDASDYSHHRHITQADWSQQWSSSTWSVRRTRELLFIWRDSRFHIEADRCDIKADRFHIVQQASISDSLTRPYNHRQAHKLTSHTILFTPSTHHTSWLESTVNWHLAIMDVRANYYRRSKIHTSVTLPFVWRIIGQWIWLHSKAEEQARLAHYYFCRPLIADTWEHSLMKSIL